MDWQQDAYKLILDQLKCFHAILYCFVATLSDAL